MWAQLKFCLQKDQKCKHPLTLSGLAFQNVFHDVKTSLQSAAIILALGKALDNIGTLVVFLR